MAFCSNEKQYALPVYEILLLFNDCKEVTSGGTFFTPVEKSAHLWQPLKSFSPVVLSWSGVEAVALPGYVGRRGKSGNMVMGHSQRTSGPGAAAARRLTAL